MEGERKFRDFDKEFLLWPFEVDVGYKISPLKTLLIYFFINLFLIIIDIQFQMRNIEMQHLLYTLQSDHCSKSGNHLSLYTL